MAKSPSPLPPLLQNLHHRREWNVVPPWRRRTSLWLVTASVFFLLVIIYSPKSFGPFGVGSKEDILQKIPTAAAAAAVSQDKKACDLFTGKWVRDEKGPSYTNWTCPTLPESKNCGKYGKDQDFLNWRWKPDECELPRFDPKAFLQLVRGKRMAFVGDSVARNQMESLLCLLSQVETPKEIYKDAEDRFRTWYFESHDFTLMALWTKFLVEGTERMINGSTTGVFDLHLDRIEANWIDKLPGIKYIIISGGHWFFRKNYFYEGGTLIGCVFCSEANITNLGINFVIRRAFRTAIQYLSKCENCDRLTLLRTFSPSHFENGLWNSGGYCNRTRPLDKGNASLATTEWDIRTSQVEELQRAREEENKGMKLFGLLDVTEAMMMRPDGHPGSHWNNEWMRGFNDCTHWCLPGAIDMWNDLLLAILKSDS